MMTKRKIIGAVIAALVLIIFSVAIFVTGWGDLVNHSSPVRLPTLSPIEGGALAADSLTYTLFEIFGPLFVLLSLVMFVAIVGAISVATEEADDDDSN